MSDAKDRQTPVPRWLHGVALLAALAVLPAVLLGAEVTTKSVGMADPQGLRTPWYFFTLDLHATPLGLLIEHGHRLAVWSVSFLCVVLAFGLMLSVRDPFYRWLGWIAGSTILLQGMLGAFRVSLNAILGEQLRTIHACFAQLAVATLIAVAVLTSRAWSMPSGEPVDYRPRTRRLALLLSVLVYLQIVFGAILRHLFNTSAGRIHILLAFLVIGLMVWLLRDILEAGPDRVVRVVVFVLLALLILQPMLGLEAWIRRFGSGGLPELVKSSPALDAVRSGHHVLGTLIFASTVMLNLFLRRPVRAGAFESPVKSLGPVAVGPVEGAV
jgi:Cytochrome oxidase assembly protein